MVQNKNQKLASPSLADVMNSLEEPERSQFAANVTSLVIGETAQLIAPHLTEEHVASLEELTASAEREGKTPEEVSQMVADFYRSAVPEFDDLVEQAAQNVQTRIQTQVSGTIET